MSMNLYVFAKIDAVLANGKTMVISYYYRNLIQTNTHDTNEIINKLTIEEKIEKYKEVISGMIEDETELIFNSYEDEITYALTDDKTLIKEVRIITAKEQIEAHKNDLKEFIRTYIEDGYTIVFTSR